MVEEKQESTTTACFFCNEERPLGRIAKKTKSIILRDGINAGETSRRFCIDKPECRLAAQAWWLA